MPTIDLRNNPIGVLIGDIPGALTSIGVPVPDGVLAAQKMSAWENLPHPDQRVRAAKETMSQAATEADWLAGQREFLDALQYGYFWSEMAGYLDGVKASRVTDALAACQDDLITAVCERFNALVPEFTESFNRLPDMARADFSPFDLNAQEHKALLSSKEIADDLRKIDGVYSQVLRLGNSDIGKGYDSTASRIGEYDSLAQLNDAAERIMVYSTNGHLFAKTLKPLSPYACPILAGGRLQLQHPKVAKVNSDELVQTAALPDHS